LIKCKCGNEFSHRKFFGDADKYLLDANIFIHSYNMDDKWRGMQCHNIFMTGKGNLATTDRVVQELPTLYDRLYEVKVYEVKAICRDVDELRYDELCPLSIADKSLIQCAIDHPEIAGIVTYDADIWNVCPKSLIKSEKDFFIGNAQAFLKRISK
jgi:hypothetical protein